ncbi:unnamed protein product, partial [Prorocentrum cordatum]
SSIAVFLAQKRGTGPRTRPSELERSHAAPVPGGAAGRCRQRPRCRQQSVPAGDAGAKGVEPARGPQGRDRGRRRRGGQDVRRVRLLLQGPDRRERPVHPRRAGHHRRALGQHRGRHRHHGRQGGGATGAEGQAREAAGGPRGGDGEVPQRGGGLRGGPVRPRQGLLRPGQSPGGHEGRHAVAAAAARRPPRGRARRRGAPRRGPGPGGGLWPPGGVLAAAGRPERARVQHHSDSIVELLEKLKVQFDAKRTETQAEYAKAKKICEDTKKELNDGIDETGDEISSLELAIDGLQKSIAQNRRSLVDSEAMLKDDKVYLRDLTEQCETAAKQWDQRSAERGKELQALAEALALLQGTPDQTGAQELDAAANERALLQKPQPALRAVGAKA